MDPLMNLLFGTPIGVLSILSVATTIVIGAVLATIFIRKSAPKQHH